MVRNTMKLVEQAHGTINAKYDMYAHNMDDIRQESNSVWDIILNSFRFGYMQGMKAAKAEMMKGGVCHE